MSWVASEAFDRQLEPILRQNHSVEEAVAGTLIFLNVYKRFSFISAKKNNTDLLNEH
jgi:hypothetical protein